MFIRYVTWNALIVRRDERWIAGFGDTPSDFPPGEQYIYNSLGFNLLGMVVAEVSGVSYPEYIRAHLFEPLGLTGSPVCDERSIIPGRAQSYELMDGVLMNDRSLGSAMGANGLCLTVLDLLSWNSALSEGRVVSPGAYRQMTTPVTLNDGSTAGYGFGLGLWSPGGHPVASHDGGWAGFTTRLTHFIDLDIDIAVCSNAGAVSAGNIGEIIERWVLGFPLPTK
jgi:CubicO group peptidase (beta-lactamase class C family)